MVRDRWERKGHAEGGDHRGVAAPLRCARAPHASTAQHAAAAQHRPLQRSSSCPYVPLRGSSLCFARHRLQSQPAPNPRSPARSSRSAPSSCLTKLSEPHKFRTKPPPIAAARHARRRSPAPRARRLQRLPLDCLGDGHVCPQEAPRLGEALKEEECVLVSQGSQAPRCKHSWAAHASQPRETRPACVCSRLALAPRLCWVLRRAPSGAAHTQTAAGCGRCRQPGLHSAHVGGRKRQCSRGRVPARGRRQRGSARLQWQNSISSCSQPASGGRVAARPPSPTPASQPLHLCHLLDHGA